MEDACTMIHFQDFWIFCFYIQERKSADRVTKHQCTVVASELIGKIQTQFQALDWFHPSMKSVCEVLDRKGIDGWWYLSSTTPPTNSRRKWVLHSNNYEERYASYAHQMKECLLDTIYGDSPRGDSDTSFRARWAFFLVMSWSSNSFDTGTMISKYRKASRPTAWPAITHKHSVAFCLTVQSTSTSRCFRLIGIAGSAPWNTMSEVSNLNNYVHNSSSMGVQISATANWLSTEKLAPPPRKLRPSRKWYMSRSDRPAQRTKILDQKIDFWIWRQIPSTPSRHFSITSLLPTPLFRIRSTWNFNGRLALVICMRGRNQIFDWPFWGGHNRGDFHGKYGRWYSFNYGQKSTRFSFLTANERIARILKDTFTVWPRAQAD